MKSHLTAFEVKTVTEMNWTGLKNGHLMRTAIDDGFDILLTIDKNLAYQQNLNQYLISVVVLDVKRSKIEYLKELVPEFKARIGSFEKGKAYRIEKK